MRIRQHMALLLAMCVGTAIAVAQFVKEEPAVDNSDTAQKQSQYGQAKLLVVSIPDIELTDDQETQIEAIRKEYQPEIEETAKELKSLRPAGVVRPSGDTPIQFGSREVRGFADRHSTR